MDEQDEQTLEAFTRKVWRFRWQLYNQIWLQDLHGSEIRIRLDTENELDEFVDWCEATGDFALQNQLDGNLLMTLAERLRTLAADRRRLWEQEQRRRQRKLVSLLSHYDGLSVPLKRVNADKLHELALEGVAFLKTMYFKLTGENEEAVPDVWDVDGGKEVAEIVGVRESTISKWKNGASRGGMAPGLLKHCLEMGGPGNRFFSRPRIKMLATEYRRAKEAVASGSPHMARTPDRTRRAGRGWGCPGPPRVSCFAEAVLPRSAGRHRR